MKLVAALLASVVGVGTAGFEAWAQAPTIDAQPIPADFNQVSVDSRDLETDPVGISSPGFFEVNTTDVVSEISLYQVERRTFPGLDEIYRDPGPARANWFRVLVRERGRSPSEANTDASSTDASDASDASDAE